MWHGLIGGLFALVALVLALFAYMGTELIGVTVGEAKNPRKTVPSAIKKTFVSSIAIQACSVSDCANGALYSGVSCSSTLSEY